MRINLNYLKAANVAASTKQTRYYLMGVSADNCAATNPRFDRKRFLSACGV